MTGLLLVVVVLVPLVLSGAVFLAAARIAGAPRCSLLQATGLLATIGGAGAGVVVLAGALVGGPGAAAAALAAIGLGWPLLIAMTREGSVALLRLWGTFVALSLLVWVPLLLAASWGLGRWIG